MKVVSFGKANVVDFILKGTRFGISYHILDELEAEGMAAIGCSYEDVNRWKSSQGNESLFQVMEFVVVEIV